MLITGTDNGNVQRSWRFQHLCAGGKANLLPTLAGIGRQFWSTSCNDTWLQITWESWFCWIL